MFRWPQNLQMFLISTSGLNIQLLSGSVPVGEVVQTARRAKFLASCSAVLCSCRPEAGE